MLVGLLIGLTGMGGGAIMTPFLIGIMQLNPVTAVGTDLVFASVIKWIGGFGHLKFGHFKLKEVGWLALGSLPASWLGSKVMMINQTNQVWLQRGFPIMLGCILLGVGYIAIFPRHVRFLKLSANKTHHGLLIIIGGLGGFLVGLTSIGGGTVIMALLILFFTLPSNKLVGLDISHGALLATFSALLYISNQHVNWLISFLLIVGGIPGVILGTKLGHQLKGLYLKRILGGLLFFLGLFYLLRELI